MQLDLGEPANEVLNVIHPFNAWGEVQLPSGKN